MSKEKYTQPAMIFEYMVLRPEPEKEKRTPGEGRNENANVDAWNIGEGQEKERADSTNTGSSLHIGQNTRGQIQMGWSYGNI